MAEEYRVRDLFKRVKKKIGDNRCDNAELEIIKPRKIDEEFFKNEMGGRIRRELLPHRKVMVINATKTSEMTDMGVAGLIAHEFAHFSDESLQDLSLEPQAETARILDASEEKADKLAAGWGFEKELKVSTAEIEGLNKAGLTWSEYNKLVDNWEPPKLRVFKRKERRR